MSKFTRRKTGGLSDVIRCDERDYVIWKWHPTGAKQGKLKRETAIRTSSVLRVKNSEVAIFFYKQQNGDAQDCIAGPYDGVIKTKNFPVLSSIIGLWYEGDTPFQAEIFFINLGKAVQIEFAVPFFDVADPRFPDLAVPIAVRGTLTFKIVDYHAFVACHQLVNFDLDDLKAKIKDSICHYVKDAVSSAPAENNIPLVQIETKLSLINDKIEISLKNRLFECFAITVVGLDIAAIELDKASENYQDLQKITAGIAKRRLEAETLDYEEKLRIEREERRYAQHMDTRQANLEAYKTEIQGQIGIAGAEAIGKMGENGAGDINLGVNGGAGFNPMTIMAGMAVGTAIGQNIAGTMNTAINPAASVPPKVPGTTYFVAIDNKPVGPFKLDEIKEMAAQGQVKSDSLLWKQGTPSWEKADAFIELSGLFPPDL